MRVGRWALLNAVDSCMGGSWPDNDKQISCCLLVTNARKKMPVLLELELALVHYDSQSLLEGFYFSVRG